MTRGRTYGSRTTPIPLSPRANGWHLCGAPSRPCRNTACSRKPGGNTSAKRAQKKGGDRLSSGTEETVGAPAGAPTPDQRDPIQNQTERGTEHIMVTTY